MKCISIKQPWAALVVEGIKPVENRNRPWKHKGPVAIHASKSFDDEGLEWIRENCMHGQFRIAKYSMNLTGGIIGSVDKTDCVTKHDSEFFSGPYGYVFENPKKCELIPWKGKQGIMNVPLCPHCLQDYEKYGPCPCIDPNGGGL